MKVKWKARMTVEPGRQPMHGCDIAGMVEVPDGCSTAHLVSTMITDLVSKLEISFELTTLEEPVPGEAFRYNEEPDLPA